MTPFNETTFPMDSFAHALWKTTILAIKGSQALAFMEAISTIQFKTLKPDNPVYGLFCTNQGRLIHDFTAVQKDSKTLLLVLEEGGDVEATLTFLNRLKIVSRRHYRKPKSAMAIFYPLASPYPTIDKGSKKALAPIISPAYQGRTRRSPLARSSF